MAAKRKLEDLLASPGHPPIRRGQGVRLSIDQDNSPQPAQSVTAFDGAKSHHRTNASSQPDAVSPEQSVRRVNRGYKLREDLIRRYKQLALDRDQHLYEVMETALEEYLDRQAEPHE
jgi:hypothetical protein